MWTLQPILLLDYNIYVYFIIIYNYLAILEEAAKCFIPMCCNICLNSIEGCILCMSVAMWYECWQRMI